MNTIISKEDTKRVYVASKSIFTRKELLPLLTTSRRIVDYLEENKIKVPPLPTCTIALIVQHLLQERVFDLTDSRAREAFPDLFAVEDASKALLPDELRLPVMEELEGPYKELTQSFERLRETGEYSDLIIACGGAEYHVHRAIVCPRSELFATACDSQSKEGREPRITLSDNDPSIVNNMIDYFYYLNYHYAADTPDTSDAGACKSDTGSTASDYSGDELLVHTSTFVLAEKYDVKGLQDLAVRKFQRVVGKYKLTRGFFDSVAEAYARMPDKETAMKNAILEVITEDAEMLENETMRGMLKMNERLAFDLLVYKHEKKVAAEERNTDLESGDALQIVEEGRALYLEGGKSVRLSPHGDFDVNLKEAP